MKTFRYLALLLLVTLFSCTKRQDEINGRIPSTAEDVKLRLSKQVWQGQDGGAAADISCGKSSLAADFVEKLNDFNVLVFDKEGNYLKDFSGYHTDRPRLTIEPETSYIIYFLANAGKDITGLRGYDGSELLSLADWQSKFRLEYSGSPGGFDKSGMPWICRCEIPGNFDFRRDVLEVRLTRLFSRWVLQLDLSDLKNRGIKFEMKSVRICQAPKMIYPLADESHISIPEEESSWAPWDAAADRLSEEDIRNLNNGGQVALYILENRKTQGGPTADGNGWCNLFPGNSAAKNKNLETVQNLYGEKTANSLTYLEMSARMSYVDKDYNSITMRSFCGQDVLTDCNNVRNVSIVKTLAMHPDPENEGWRKEVDAPVEKRPFILGKYGKDDIRICKNYSQQIEVQSPYVFSLTAEGKHGVKLSGFSDQNFDGNYYHQTLTVSTNESLTGFQDPTEAASPYIDSHIVITDESGTVRTEIPVKIYHEIFPITIRMEGNSFRLFSENPLGFGFLFSPDTEFPARLVVPDIAGQALYFGNVDCSDLNMSIKPAFGSEGNSFVTGSCDIGKAGDRFPQNIQTGFNGSSVGVSYTVHDSYGYPLMRALYPSDLSTGQTITDTTSLAFDTVSGISIHFPVATYHQNLQYALEHDPYFKNTFFRSFDACPFYVTNGDLRGVSYVIQASKSEKISGRNVSKISKLSVSGHCFSPGRDLDASSGTLYTTYLTEYYPDLYFTARFDIRLTETRSTFNGTQCTLSRAGEYDCKYQSRYYMTINGSPCWPGASGDEYGTSRIRLYGN